MPPPPIPVPPVDKDKEKKEKGKVAMSANLDPLDVEFDQLWEICTEIGEDDLAKMKRYICMVALLNLC
jgi:hypothetical protein